MNKLLFLIMTLAAFGCSPNSREKMLQQKIDSLENVIAAQNKIPATDEGQQTDSTDSKEQVKKNISSWVTASVLLTPKGTLSHFSEVSLTARNKSDYKIDSYKILCQYHDSKGNKSQSLSHVFVLEPHSALTFKMADCEKKGDVTIQVVELKSAALDL